MVLHLRPLHTAKTLSMAVQAWEPSTCEAETGGFLCSRSAWSTERVRGQPGLHRETLSLRKRKEGRKQERKREKKKTRGPQIANDPKDLPDGALTPKTHVVERETRKLDQNPLKGGRKKQLSKLSSKCYTCSMAHVHTRVHSQIMPPSTYFLIAASYSDICL